jgi:replication initiation and membrane attachment protein DnaB
LSKGEFNLLDPNLFTEPIEKIAGIWKQLSRKNQGKNFKGMEDYTISTKGPKFQQAKVQKKNASRCCATKSWISKWMAGKVKKKTTSVSQNSLGPPELEQERTSN